MECAPRYSTVGDKRVIVSLLSQPSVGGVTVSIVAFQAVDPGSTPGQRRNFLSFFQFHMGGAHNQIYHDFVVFGIIIIIILLCFFSLSPI